MEKIIRCQGAGALIIHENSFLMVQRSIHDYHEPGTWSIPGGMREDYENSSYATMVREVFEETNIKVSNQNTSIIKTHEHYQPWDGFQFITFFLD